ncbi:DUF2461 domain-containing protein [Tomitella fengzijianii]|uniref:DUF2461 domain-containing protein n=1 Tax=Tomitella fengzijianii TaxID=2597660 RepID=A0A516X1W0_9ACTN|nr:DUF2461 domain-containing protein [Tomitella fengzijianii]QDQ97074.1 DUF2461 domain-containing protein [Tomitella fengzijianii]
MPPDGTPAPADDDGEGGGFTGIPFAALDFYEDLEADNSRAWWQPRKDIYRDTVRAPMTALAAALEDEFGVAKVFRPYRDVRFSKDKTPYKTHQGVFTATAPGTGYYVAIDAAGLSTAGGCYSLTSDQLARLRSAIDDDVRGVELENIVARLAGAGFTIGGDRLKTHPRGYPADHPRIGLLRHRSLTARLEHGCPEWVQTPAALDRVRESWRAVTPLVEWLTQVVG